MNRRTLLATTSLALAPQLPNQISTGTADRSDDDPLTLADLLADIDAIPRDWRPGTPASHAVSNRDEPGQTTVRGVRSRPHPGTDDRVATTFAERRFVTDSALPVEFEHLDVALQVARVGENAPHDDRHDAVRALHEATVADEPENWDAMSTGWVDTEIAVASDWLRGQSVALLRKPICAVPDDVELSTDKPVLEMAVAVTPLPWGIVVVTGTNTDPDADGVTRRLVTRLADHTTATVRGRPLPVEARP